MEYSKAKKKSVIFENQDVDEENISSTSNVVFKTAPVHCSNIHIEHTPANSLTVYRQTSADGGMIKSSVRHINSSVPSVTLHSRTAPVVILSSGQKCQPPARSLQSVTFSPPTGQPSLAAKTCKRRVYHAAKSVSSETISSNNQVAMTTAFNTVSSSHNTSSNTQVAITTAVDSDNVSRIKRKFQPDSNFPIIISAKINPCNNVENVAQHASSSKSPFLDGPSKSTRSSKTSAESASVDSPAKLSASRTHIINRFDGNSKALLENSFLLSEETPLEPMDADENEVVADTDAIYISEGSSLPCQSDTQHGQPPVVMFKWGTTNKPFRCQICDMAFENGSLLKDHLGKHVKVTRSKSNPHICTVCAKSFSNNHALERHMLQHYGKQVSNRCKFCYKVLANKANYDKHLEMHKGGKQFQCPHCEYRFLYKQGLQSHLLTHSGEKPFKCNVCDKAFNRKDILERHELTHLEKPNRHKCVECGKMFSYLFVLKKHMRNIHSGEMDGQTCEFCGKFIKNSENVARHLRIHTGERPFKCDVCSSAFVQKQHLIDHMAMHTNERNFNCIFCGEAFKYRQSLNRHLCCHNKEKTNIPCPKCSKTFAEESSMMKHLDLHSTFKHHCTVCGMPFQLGKSLKRHMNKKHPKELNMVLRNKQQDKATDTESDTSTQNDKLNINAHLQSLAEKLFGNSTGKFTVQVSMSETGEKQVILLINEDATACRKTDIHNNDACTATDLVVDNSFPASEFEDGVQLQQVFIPNECDSSITETIRNENVEQSIVENEVNLELEDGMD